MDKSVNKPVQTEENYRLTEENWATINPMIGLSEDDIAAFLTTTKKDLESDSLRATPSLFIC